MKQRNSRPCTAVSRTACRGSDADGLPWITQCSVIFWWLWKSCTGGSQLHVTAPVRTWTLKSHAAAHYFSVCTCTIYIYICKNRLIINNIWAISSYMLTLMSAWEKASNKAEYMLVPFLSLHFWALHYEVYEHRFCSISLQQTTYATTIHHLLPATNIIY